MLLLEVGAGELAKQGWGSMTRVRRKTSFLWRSWKKTKPQNDLFKSRSARTGWRSCAVIPLQPVDHVSHQGVGDAGEGLFRQQDGCSQLVQDQRVPVHLFLSRFELGTQRGTPSENERTVWTIEHSNLNCWLKKKRIWICVMSAKDTFAYLSQRRRDDCDQALWIRPLWNVFHLQRGTELVINNLQAWQNISTERLQSHLLCAQLSLSVLQLLGVLLPDSEDPVVATKVVSAWCLAVLFSDCTYVNEMLRIMYFIVLKFLQDNISILYLI